MARKQAARPKNGKKRRGPRGRQGPQGPAGTPGQNAPLDVIDRLTKELETAQRELRVQFTRIAQLQAEVDQLRAAVKNASN